MYLRASLRIEVLPKLRVNWVIDWRPRWRGGSAVVGRSIGGEMRSKRLHGLLCAVHTKFTQGEAGR